MPHNIRIREAIPDDDTAIEEISRLAIEDLRKVYRPIPAKLNHIPAAPLKRIVAEIDGKVVGTVRYRCEPSRLLLIGLFVHPDHRQKGIARRIVEYLAETARGLGADRLSLHTVKETGNVPIFQRLGFKVIRESVDMDSESVSGELLHDAYIERLL